MPRISVVVPVYNVEAYLPACLDSLARQTVADLEVVVVDDGSPDGSRAIAEEYAARDPRFKVVTRPNGGLSAARNTGLEHISGEYLAFVDSDDVLPPDAYALLLGALEQSGSDFATGNVHRLTRWGTFQAAFLARAFARSEQAAHVTRLRPLLADRIVWNKLWRRTFWEGHGYRFPEGRIHEDIPITIPAHFAARSVDVIAEPVYYWRIREGGELSITQRRLELRALDDRMQAVEEVSRHLADHGPRRARRWYDESVVADDLKLHLNVLDRADDDYRERFMTRVNAFLDEASPRIYDRLPAIDRLKWHMVRRRALPELLEVLRFAKEDLNGTPPVRIRGRWYGDYPFRDDPRMKVPRAVYRLETADLPGVVHLEELRREGEALRVRGFAYIAGIGAASQGAQAVQAVALQPGRLRRVRLRVAPLRLPTSAVHRPDATARSGQPIADVSWSGFEARLDPRALRGKPGAWELYVTVRAGGVRRRRARFVLDRAQPLRGASAPAGEDALVRAVPTDANGVTFEVLERWGTLESARGPAGGRLELGGSARPAPAEKAKLELRRPADAAVRRMPLERTGTGWAAGVPLAELAAAGTPPDDGTRAEDSGALAWRLALTGGGRAPVLLGDARAPWVTRTREGDAAVLDGPDRAELEDARWTPDGRLELEGTLPAGADVLLLRSREGIEEHGLAPAVSGGRFTVGFSPAAMRSLAGTLPLGEGVWTLVAGGAPVLVAPALAERLPLGRDGVPKRFAVAVAADGAAVLAAERDLADDERGPYHQRRLQAAATARRAEPLRDAVVYFSFGGRQYSDSPRAIHEELVRRGAPLEHLWVVRDGACAVPETARVLRKGSREYFEALAGSRYVVANDHLPPWFARRADQVCVQTLHGTPLRRQGFDVAERGGKAAHRLLRGLDEQIANWRYLLSPNGYATEVLRGAYGVEEGLLETGLPRTDLLAGGDRDARRRAVRERLGLPDGARVVLYAPTYRDEAVDRRGRYRLDRHVDLERLRAAAGDDAIVLFRKHPFITDASPAGVNGRARDVSGYPDGTELLLAADVLVTDYSSLMVDFANLGGPMLFFAYDLDAYAAAVRGFYLDFEATVPGPLLRTLDELTDALADPEAATAPYARRYEAFAARFCEHDDGHAAARVVDAVFA